MYKLGQYVTNLGLRVSLCWVPQKVLQFFFSCYFCKKTIQIRFRQTYLTIKFLILWEFWVLSYVDLTSFNILKLKETNSYHIQSFKGMSFVA